MENLCHRASSKDSTPPRWPAPSAFYGRLQATSATTLGRAQSTRRRVQVYKMSNGVGLEKNFWGGKRESNPQPSEPQSGALPVELFPPPPLIIATGIRQDGV